MKKSLTVFFNWGKILSKYKTPKEVIDFFARVVKTKTIPEDFSGNSFIINVSSLLHSNYTINEKFDYIALAAIRNYFDYEYYQEMGLLIDFSPVDINKLKNNRLLRFTKDYIKFKFEEEINGTKVW